MPKISDEQRDARRRSILGAALRCYRRDGYFETQMKDIAAEAEISVGLLYRYFDDKEALLFAVMEASREADRRGRAEKTEDRPAEEALRSLARGIVELHADPEQLDMLRGNVRAFGEATRLEAAELDVVQPSLREAVEDFSALIRRGQQEGAFEPSLDPSAVARMMIAMISGSNILRVFDTEFDPTAHGVLVERMIDGLLRPSD